MADTTIDLLKNSSYVGKMDELIAAVKLGSGATSDVEWDNVKNKPTTIAGYGITDAKIENGTITLGNQTITPLTSAPVTSVNNKTGAVVLTANDVGALPNTTTIPDKTSQLDNDSGYITNSALTDYAKKTEIPTALPNPNALTFTGAVTGSYDGSEAMTVEIPSGGGGEGSFNLIDTYDVSTGALSYETTGLNLNEIVMVINPAGNWNGQMLYINNTSVGFHAKAAKSAVWLRKLAGGIFQEIDTRGASDSLALTMAVPVPGDKIETIKVEFSSVTSGIIKIYGR